MNCLQGDRLFNMKVSILTYAAGLKVNLCSKLNTIGPTANRVDYNKPLRNQITDSDILINGLGQLDRHIIDICPNLKLVQQIGTGTDNVDVPYLLLQNLFM